MISKPIESVTVWATRRPVWASSTSTTTAPTLPASPLRDPKMLPVEGGGTNSSERVRRESAMGLPASSEIV